MKIYITDIKTNLVEITALGSKEMEYSESGYYVNYIAINRNNSINGEMFFDSLENVTIGDIQYKIFMNLERAFKEA